MSNKKDQATLFRQALGNYPTGVTVVTGIDESGEPIGLTVNSFASVSIDPLLILWSVDENVSTYETFKNIDKFAVNILAEDQRDVAVIFSTKEEERFKNSNWELSEHGLPVLTGAIATLQCTTFQTVEVGDHTTLFGEVIDVSATDRAPLLYHKRHIGPLPKEFHEGK